MAVRNRTADELDVPSSDVADAVGEAQLVHLLAMADSDSLAAASLLGRTCADVAVPYHISVVRTAAGAHERLERTDTAAIPVTLGFTVDTAVGLDPDGAVSPLAYDVAADLGGRPDALTALAGVVATGADPSQATPGLLDTAGIERAPGVAVPTADLADGLAHTGLVHTAFSGDIEAVDDALAEIGLAGGDTTALDDGDRRRIASMVALAAVGSDGPTRSSTAAERALRPFETEGPFATLGGHADVLMALAERAPGLAAALTVGEGGREVALDAWREHGRAVHAGVRHAETARYPGLVVARTGGPVAAVARLLCDFRSPEPMVLAIGTGEAAAVAVEEPVDGPLATAADAGGGSSLTRATRGYATFDVDRTERFIDAFREAR